MRNRKLKIGKRKQTRLWRTEDGQQIRICDMEDSHLISVIKKLMYSGITKSVEKQLLYFWCGGNEDLSKWRDFMPSIFKDLVRDAKRRKLNLSFMVDPPF